MRFSPFDYVTLSDFCTADHKIGRQEGLPAASAFPGRLPGRIATKP